MYESLHAALTFRLPGEQVSNYFNRSTDYPPRRTVLQIFLSNENPIKINRNLRFTPFNLNILFSSLVY
jgi:hypothetical protein